MNEPSLILAIVQPEDADTVLGALVEAGLRVTEISSLGGFLRADNVTLLLGAEQGQVAQAVNLLAANCRTRTAVVNASFPTLEIYLAGCMMPLEAEVGGATIFTLPVEQMVRVGLEKDVFTTDKERRLAGMKLVIAIIPEERASDALNDLIAAQYRATLVSTTGGFWRKGNATLLIGVDAPKVENVLERIESVCAGPAQRQEKPETAWTTMFVLDVAQYKRV